MAEKTVFSNPQNRARSFLASSITSADTTLALQSGGGSLFPSPPFLITIDDEILRVTAKTGDTLTVSRGQEGTIPASHNAGSPVELRITAGALIEIHSAVNNLEETGHVLAHWSFSIPGANQSLISSVLLGGVSDQTLVVTPRSGSLTGISALWTGRTGGSSGSLTIAVRVNGSTVWSIALSATTTKVTATSTAGTYNLSAGDEIGVSYSTDSSWNGTGGNILVTVFMSPK
jgi:hypothetical protein